MADTPRTEQQIAEANLAAKGQAIEAKVWKLPLKFQLTKEMLAAADASQAELAKRAALPYGSMSVADAYRAQSVHVAEDLRRDIEHVKNQIKEALVTGKGELDQLQAALLALRHRRAERLAAIGRYDLAAEEEPQQAYRDEYERILVAIWRDDAEKCNCPPSRGSGHHADKEASQWHATLDVWSVKHGHMVSLMRCNTCQFMNAVDTPKEVAQGRSHRRRARVLSGSMNPTDAANALTRAGHTFGGLQND